MGAAASPPPVLPDWVWAHLARHDRVAGSLVGVFGAAGVIPPAPLHAMAVRDGQQRLVLLQQALEVGRVLQQAGVHGVFLKGAAEIADPAADVTGDLDVLVAEGELVGASDALGRAGWVCEQQLDPGTMHAAYFSRVGEPGKIDLHLTGHDWGAPFVAACLAESVPLAGVPGAWVPLPQHRAWHLLLHAVVQHPERRGSLRDGRRLRRLALAMSTDGHAWLADKVAGHRQRRRLAALWAAACTSLPAVVAAEGGELAAAAREWLARTPMRGGWFVHRRQPLLFVLLGPLGGWRELLRQQYRLQGGSRRPGWGAWWRWWVKVPARYALTAALTVAVLPRAWAVWREWARALGGNVRGGLRN